ncbi:hypothetical protein AMAG_16637 [Allomyces macrogynus ATCC 38327]|uniref:Chitin-binding type-4 domain-containing protein n=1 Tax=Allomyces macrogynus (strain ATCC 38327) TaxID=578462 RepID=A0A0L0TBS2_ALLM3|nr:hypothetical protein AMAG_16637 [Allomyces macrogynus ATCC 38327]|eukprot:KNE72145.1 hypothetical protein AMAG_16637 [Allomyces macrogynus ATCC 38327]
MTSTSTLSLLLLVALLAVSSAHGHMVMRDPPPRHSHRNPGPSGQIDYDDTSPLGTFPCKGYRAQKPVRTVRAGTSIPVTIGGDAPHNGGHCQFALSYDGEKTWVVVETVIRDCMRYANPYSVDVPIPKSAPAGTAAFAWTWINAVGNREYYMACTDLVIENPDTTAALTGPELLVANLPGFPLRFPEFPGNSYDMREVFEKRRVITVRGNGAVTPPPTTTTKKPGKDQKDPPTSTAVATTSTAAPKPTITTTTAAPKPTTTAAPEPTTTAAPKPTTSTSSTRSTRVPKPTTTTTPSKPTPTDGGAKCVDGTWRCAGNGTLMGQCVRGVFMDMQVPEGAKCSTELTGSPLLVAV